MLFISVWQEINPSLEIDLSKLLVHIHRCIIECDSGSNADTQLSADNQLAVTVTSKLSGLPFCWKFFAAPVSMEMVISASTCAIFVLLGFCTHGYYTSVHIPPMFALQTI